MHLKKWWHVFERNEQLWFLLSLDGRGVCMKLNYLDSPTIEQIPFPFVGSLVFPEMSVFRKFPDVRKFCLIHLLQKNRRMCNFRKFLGISGNLTKSTDIYVILFRLWPTFYKWEKIWTWHELVSKAIAICLNSRRREVGQDGVVLIKASHHLCWFLFTNTIFTSYTKQATFSQLTPCIIIQGVSSVHPPSFNSSVQQTYSVIQWCCLNMPSLME